VNVHLFDGLVLAGINIDHLNVSSRQEEGLFRVWSSIEIPAVVQCVSRGGEVCGDALDWSGMIVYNPLIDDGCGAI
jgi:hypothetical protein